jgi:hypothetical protein
MTSADYVYQAVKGIKKVFDNAMSNMLDGYMDNRVIKFYGTSEATEIFTSTESLTGVRELAEEETPDSLALEDGYSKTISEDRFGGAIVVPEKVYRRDGKDSTLKVDNFLTKQMNQLLMAAKNKLLSSSFYMLNNAHLSTADTLAPDSVELCGTHTWATGGTFDNSATAALDADAVDDLEEYGGKFMDPTDTDRPFPHDFDVIIVKKGSANARMAKKLFAFGISPVAVEDINIYQGEKTVVETPYITYTNRNYWFARCSQMENSVVVGIGEMPTLREPIKQNNEAIRTNATGFWKRGIVNLPHDWYGSDGTT